MAEPRPKTDFGVFEGHRTLIFSTHDKICGGQFALSSPYSKYTQLTFIPTPCWIGPVAGRRFDWRRADSRASIIPDMQYPDSIVYMIALYLNDRSQYVLSPADRLRVAVPLTEFLLEPIVFLLYRWLAEFSSCNDINIERCVLMTCKSANRAVHLKLMRFSSVCPSALMTCRRGWCRNGCSLTFARHRSIGAHLIDVNSSQQIPTGSGVIRVGVTRAGPPLSPFPSDATANWFGSYQKHIDISRFLHSRPWSSVRRSLSHEALLFTLIRELVVIKLDYCNSVLVAVSGTLQLQLYNQHSTQCFRLYQNTYRLRSGSTSHYRCRQNDESHWVKPQTSGGYSTVLQCTATSAGKSQLGTFRWQIAGVQGILSRWPYMTVHVTTVMRTYDIVPVKMGAFGCCTPCIGLTWNSCVQQLKHI